MPYNYQGYNSAGSGLLQGVNLGLRLMNFRDQRKRRNLADERATTEFDNRQEDRTLQLTRQQTQYDQGQEDRSLRLKNQNEDRDYLVNTQRPKADELHETRMQTNALQQEVAKLNFADTKDELNRQRLGYALSFVEDFQNAIDGQDDIDPEKFLSSIDGLFGDAIGEGIQTITANNRLPFTNRRPGRLLSTPDFLITRPGSQIWPDWAVSCLRWMEPNS